VNFDASRRVQRMPHLWWIYYAFGFFALAVYFLLPAGQKSALYTGIGISAALAVVVGVILHRPAAPLGWLMLAAGQISYATGDVLYFIKGAENGGTAVDVCYLGMYVFLIFGLVV